MSTRVKKLGLTLATAGALSASATAGLYWATSSGQAQAQVPAPAAPTAPLLQGPYGDPNIYVNLAKQIVPSVVNISTLTRVEAPSFRGGPDEMFRFFFEGRERGFPWRPRAEPPGQPQYQTGSLGTGFIIDGSGIILTNNHVVAEADEIRIHFTESPDEKPTEGKVIGRDPELDVALIQVKTDRVLAPLPLGDSDKLQVGEYVAAVGNPFGQGHSMSHGIISAKGRFAPGFPLATYLQTDAPINPGNSGGPLVNLKGEVIGINNAIDARAQGIGFAIPINVVKNILPQLKSQGAVSRGYLGILLDGNKVRKVYPGAPADQAGLRENDVIVEIDGQAVESGQEITMQVASQPAGKKLPVKVLRSGKVENFKVELGRRPISQES